MSKVLGILSILIGLVIGIYNHLFRAANVAKSAVLQLEDSDAVYGVGAGLAKTDSATLLTIVSITLIAFGFYCYFKKQINGYFKELDKWKNT